MAERVRILLHEAEDADRVVREYKYYLASCYCGPHIPYYTEELVNRIGEIYEKALARGTVKVNR